MWTIRFSIPSEIVHSIGFSPIRDLSADWSRLTHLDLAGGFGRWRPEKTLSMFYLAQILRGCSGFVYCRIKLFGYREHPSPLLVPVQPPDVQLMQLPLLQGLSIVMDGNILPFTENSRPPHYNKLVCMLSTTKTVLITALALPLCSNLGRALFRNLSSIPDTSITGHSSRVLRKCPDLISLTLKQATDPFADRRRDFPSIRVDDEFLKSISTNNSDVLCSQIEEFICDYFANFSSAGLVEFIKRKEDGSTPKLAKLKKVATMLHTTVKETHTKSLSCLASYGHTCPKA
jgi:hypothetical protein